VERYHIGRENKGMKTKMKCGVILEHRLNLDGVLMVNLLNAGGSISVTCNDKPENYIFPDEAELVISPKNIPILKKLIDSYYKQYQKNLRRKP
jgi:hypothetical protein